MDGGAAAVARWSLGLCMLVLLIALARSSEVSTVVTLLDPAVAVRGHPLSVTVFPRGHTECKLTMNSDDIIPLQPIPTVSPPTTTTWAIEGEALSVRVIVKPGAKGPTLAASVDCNNGPTPVVISVTSDVVLNVTVETTPNPADKDKPLSANVRLLNTGGHAAAEVKCTFSAVGDNQPTLGCPASASANDKQSCSFTALQPNDPTFFWLNFTTITDDTPVSMTCSAYNVPDLKPFQFSVLMKRDAKIVVSTECPKEVAAGASLRLLTTVRNIGTAQADGLDCVLRIAQPALAQFQQVNSTICESVPVPTSNTTIGSVHCNFSVFAAKESALLALDFKVDASLKNGSKLDFEWACSVLGLANMASTSVQVATNIDSGLKLDLPATTTAGGTQALLFDMQTTGPSYLRDTVCTFTTHKDVTYNTYSGAPLFKCAKDTHSNTTTLTCTIAELSPPGATFSLGPCKVAGVQYFVVNTTCTSLTPASEFAHIFNITVGQAPSPSPVPLMPATDNTLVVIVTVVVAIGLLIVIAIWWRKKQDRHGWDASGPKARSPSLNRFTEMELSVRSDD